MRIHFCSRIAKAIDLDKLFPVDDTVKYSSSAVDTLAIFYQIKVFWQQLDWPEAEGAFTFVGKIIDVSLRRRFASNFSKK
jgi:BAI1-associated protein 3